MGLLKDPLEVLGRFISAGQDSAKLAALADSVIADAGELERQSPNALMHRVNVRPETDDDGELLPGQEETSAVTVTVSDVTGIMKTCDEEHIDLNITLTCRLYAQDTTNEVRKLSAVDLVKALNKGMLSATSYASEVANDVDGSILNTVSFNGRVDGVIVRSDIPVFTVTTSVKRVEGRNVLASHEKKVAAAMPDHLFIEANISVSSIRSKFML